MSKGQVAAGRKADVQETGDSDMMMTALVEMLKEQQKSMVAQQQLLLKLIEGQNKENVQ